MRKKTGKYVRDENGSGDGREVATAAQLVGMMEKGNWRKDARFSEARIETVKEWERKKAAAAPMVYHGPDGDPGLRGRAAEIMPEVCFMLAGGKSVSEMCREKGWERQTIMMWARQPEWRGVYQAAREQLGEWQAERLMEMVDEADSCTDHVQVQALRLKVDTYKWIAGRHFPRVYGDRVDVTSLGEKIVGVMALPSEVSPEPTE